MPNEREKKKRLPLADMLKTWEFTIFMLLIAVFVINLILSPDLFRVANLFDATLTFTEKSILTLPMALLIISGVIDISVASISAMSGVILGVCYKAGMAIGYATVIGLAVGLSAGLLNGVIITRLKIPSIVVTLAMMLFYRGVGYILLGDTAVRDLPQRFGLLGGAYSSTFIPIQFMIFILLAVIFGFLLHRTRFGRLIYIVGNNENTARYSGVRVDRIRLILCGVTGLIAGLSGILLTSRIGSARPDIAQGNEMAVITICLLGGVYIFGGKGSIIGVVIAALMIGYVHYGLSILNVQEQVIRIFTGGLLIIALLIPTIASRFRASVKHRRGGS
ncbi:MAG: ABC transporter permease [Spirochaetes bacterium]|nr:ABC transporter permease [Spirochaetota bacterium]